MSTQRYISTSFWTDKWVRKLDPSERYLYMYLLTNPQTNISGIYQITLDRIAFDTGYDERTLEPMFERFRKAGKAAFIKDEWIILPSWPKHQKWDIKPTIKKGIESVLASTPKDVISYAKDMGYTYPIDSLLVGYTYQPSYSDLDSDSDLDSEDTPDKPAKPQKHKHGEYAHVLLTSDEYLRLCEEWGEPELLRMIKQLDEGIELKKYKYSNHSLAIRKWKEKDRGTPIPKQIKWQEKKMCPTCGNELTGLFCKTCMIQYNEKLEETF